MALKKQQKISILLITASVAEWSIAMDCKSIAFGLRRFESCPAHRVEKADTFSLESPIY